MTDRIKLAGVMGDPVGHSLSPLLHAYWINKYEIAAAYLPYHVKPADLEDALKALPKLGIEGVNLTIPHKEAAINIVDDISDTAHKMGAINTVKVQENGTLYGTNTDGEGFIGNLTYRLGDLSSYLEHCLIIGAGGAAKGVAVALKEAGASQISITNRTGEKAEALAENIQAKTIDWGHKEAALADMTLLINTTSLGMKDQPALEISLEKLPQSALVTDIVYSPLMTDLLRQAEARGNPIVTGIGMLIHQAVSGFELWFGQKPEVDDALYDLLEASL